MVTVQAESNMEKKIYQHKDKTIGKSGYSHDGEYEFVCVARMKNPVTRGWQDCVIYKNIKTNRVFVRDKECFFENFVQV